MLVLTTEMMFLGEASFQGREGEGVGSETVATHQVKFFWLKLLSKTLFRATFFSTEYFQENQGGRDQCRDLCHYELGCSCEGEGKA